MYKATLLFVFFDLDVYKPLRVPGNGIETKNIDHHDLFPDQCILIQVAHKIIEV